MTTPILLFYLVFLMLLIFPFTLHFSLFLLSLPFLLPLTEFSHSPFSPCVTSAHHLSSHFTYHDVPPIPPQLILISFPLLTIFHLSPTPSYPTFLHIFAHVFTIHCNQSRTHLFIPPLFNYLPVVTTSPPHTPLLYP